MDSQKFEQMVEDLHKQKPKPPLDYRRRQVSDLIESYISLTGQKPSPKALKRLGDYLLIDTLVDQQKHKRNTNYPFQTNKQDRRRKKKVFVLQ